MLAINFHFAPNGNADYGYHHENVTLQQLMMR